jgi:hypothetical protein
MVDSGQSTITKRVPRSAGLDTFGKRTELMGSVIHGYAVFRLWPKPETSFLAINKQAGFAARRFAVPGDPITLVRQHPADY